MAERARDIAPIWSDLVFPFPRNWTPIIFFGMLGLLHLGNAALSFGGQHYEAYPSLLFGTVFFSAAIGWRLTRCDLGVLSSTRQIRLRTRLLCFRAERFIPFNVVHGVRLFSQGGESDNGFRVEILCENEDIECPPSSVPQQQALCLAMLIGVTLIKVSNESPGDGGLERKIPQPQPN